MTMRMLIDARHREETRVAVVKGNRIEEFDFESAERKQLKGNIYLAKVTRVEPSLQAAFVEYGGNRHGFLAFSEIHPDYYQIPKEDREALLREEAEHAAEEEALRAAQEDDEDAYGEAGDPDIEAIERLDDDGAPEMLDAAEDHDHDDTPPPAPSGNGNGGDENAVEEIRRKRMNLRRRYKIQDVIRRRQVLLVQVVKEERGNKGAALTTYLSLAGRYCVLMPNTSHGGGISRKISNGADRKRLKSIMAELDLPKTMGCIVRTAGLQRTKVEIKRDFDYLARLWDEIREKTLTSSAPALIYGDSDLIKRAIRDIYNRDIEEIVIEGEDGYRAARSFMKLLMPSHTRRIQHYADIVPLFQRFGVEDQLAAMYQPLVQLKSGGYLVINPTEALVSIDINSGRSTREHNIEQTATATNLEAAREIARQLRLRDMAGLVVIDFIDMENNSNVRKVEKAMKEALKDDRARIQVGRISSFGLMEMSRQRLRTGVLEASTRTCPHCEGTGLVRTASSAGLTALRMLEEEAARGRGSRLLLRCSQEAAFYVLNRKRAELAEIEDRYGVMIEVMSDGAVEGARMTVEAGGPPPAAPRQILFQPIVEEDDFIPEEEDEEIEEEAEAEREASVPSASGEARGEDGGSRRRRRRRRRGRRGDDDHAEGQDEAVGSDENDDVEGVEVVTAEAGDEVVAEESEAAETGDAGEGEGRRRRGRRGRRGGRRRGGEGQELTADNADEGNASDAETVEAVETPGEATVPVTPDVEAPVEVAAAAEPVAEVEVEAPAETKPRRRSRKKETAAAVEAAPAETVEAPAEPVAEAPAAPAPKRSRRKAAAAEPAVPEDGTAPAEAAPPKRTRARKVQPAAEAPSPVEAPEASPPASDAANDTAQVAPAAGEGEGEGDGETPRRGWWQRTFGN